MTAKIDQTQQDRILQTLKMPYESVMLQCDEQEIILSVQETKPLRYAVTLYVNRKLNSDWLNPDNRCPESKYLRTITRSLYTAKERQNAIKFYGKAYAKRHGIDKKITLFTPYFTSGKQALTHLCKISQNIRVIAIGAIQVGEALKGDSP